MNRALVITLLIVTGCGSRATVDEQIILMRLGKSFSITTIHEAAENGDSNAQRALGEAFFWGYGVGEDWGESVKWYLKSAESGNPEAQFYAGINSYFGSFGFPHSIETGKKYLELAAAAGHQNALCTLLSFNDQETQKWERVEKSSGADCGHNQTDENIE